MSNASFDDLERAYETLAVAIDQAGPENDAIFLAKLALVLAERLKSPTEFEACITIALADLTKPKTAA
jgi:hypothetical protein